MAIQVPSDITVGDICTEALKESGALGVGQNALAEDINGAWARLQMMLQEWERKRWLVYQLKNYVFNSTGAQTYTFGPGGDIDTGTGTVRPAKIESGFLRQITQSQPNQIDYPLEILQAREDYDRVAIKGLVAFPMSVFLDPGWPLATVYVWPVPTANIYAVGLSVMQQLPSSFPALATIFSLPYEYYSAMLYNLAVRLRPKYQLPTYPGDPLPMLAKNSLATLRGANAAIARLHMPPGLRRPGLYNIFSDRSY